MSATPAPPTDTTSAAFFEEKYAATADPWNFATDDYEQGRYAATLRALQDTFPERRFLRAFEPGCSVGALTERLAALCDEVDACDLSPTAAMRARERCAALEGVHVHCAALSAEEPWSRYDLVVLSEIGYYFTADAWNALVQRMTGELQPGAAVVAAHWMGTSPDHVTSGDAVHAALLAQSGLEHLRGERHAGPTGGFRLDIFCATTGKQDS